MPAHRPIIIAHDTRCRSRHRSRRTILIHLLLTLLLLHHLLLLHLLRRRIITAQRPFNIEVLPLVLIMLALGIDEPLLSQAPALLQEAEFLIVLRHLALSFVHEAVVLEHLALEGLEDGLGDAGAVDAAYIAEGALIDGRRGGGAETACRVGDVLLPLLLL